MSLRRLSEQSYTNRGLGKPGAYVVGTATAFAAAVTLPTHQTGDMIVMFARASAVNTTPALPSGWTTIVTSTGSNYANVRVGYITATGSSTASGTWTSANALIAVVIRRATGIGSSIATQITTNLGNSPSITLTNGNGRSVLLYFYGWGDGVNTQTSVSASAPTGYTRRIDAWSGTSIGVALNTKNDTTADGVATQTATVSGWAGHSVVEILGA